MSFIRYFKTDRSDQEYLVARQVKDKMILVAVLALFSLMLYPSISYSEVLYVGANETYKTIQSGVNAMSSGDTLIIRNGTYSGASNMINWDNRPPDGTADNYTKIYAETIGGVLIDGGNSYVPLSLEHAPTGSSYIIFNGITFGRSSGACVRIGYGSHIKLMNCAAYDSAPGDHLFSSYHSSYMLYEDCWGWGHAQYAFHFRVCDHSIARRCVARIDWATAGDAYVSGFFNYESNYMEWQNCIVIDQNQSTYLSNNDNGAGGTFCFHLGNNGTISHDVAYRGCMVLNSFGTAGFLVSNQDYALSYNDCIVWDHKTKDLIYNRDHSEPEAVYDHCTIGGTAIESARGFYCSGFVGTTVNNSLVYGLTNGTALMNIGSADRNSLYNNASNTVATSSTNTLTTDPLMKYIVRTEAGSELEGAASDGGSIGATVVKKTGVSGTLWGESGYNTTTNENLWPFPNEDMIRTKMRAYSYDGGNLTGNRGFCNDGQTLTKYIWEYLGNTIPPEIYASQDDTTPPGDVTEVASLVNNGELTLSWTNPEDADFAGTMIRYGSATYPANYTDGSLFCDRPAAAGSSDSFTGTLVEGIYYLSIFTYDQSGNFSQTVHVMVEIEAPIEDTTAPTGSITINGGAGDTENTAVKLTLNAQDTESAITWMQFSNDAANWTSSEAYNTSKSWTVEDGLGLKTVYVKFQDEAGNWSENISDTIELVDRTPPSSPTGVVAN